MMRASFPKRGWLFVEAPNRGPLYENEDLEEISGVRIVHSEIGGGGRIEIPQNAWGVARVQRFLNKLDIPRHLLDWPVAPFVFDPPRRELFPHQRTAAERFLQRDGLLLGDQMGCGKTSTAIAAALAGKDFPVLIIGPKYLRDVWRSELVACGVAPERFTFLEGTTKQRGDVTGADFIFLHYDIVDYWWSKLSLMRPRMTIVDEAHHLKNGRTKRAKGVALACSGVGRRLLMTGTPVSNRLGEIWNLLTLATGRRSWGDPVRFRLRYAGAYHDGHGYRDGEPTNQEEFHERLGTCYLRRTLKDIGANLPPLSRQLTESTLTDTQKRNYTKRFDRYTLHEVVDAILTGRASDRTFELIAKSRKMTSQAKFTSTLEQVDTALAEGEKVVVFTWERYMAERIAQNRGIAVTGELDAKDRAAAVHDFQETPRPRVLAATYGALSTGVTLHAARLVILHDLDWVPATMLQAEARVYRIGQTRSVVSRWAVARGTLDEFIARLVMSKADVIAKTVRDEGPKALSVTLGEFIPEDDVERRMYDFVDQLRM